MSKKVLKKSNIIFLAWLVAVIAWNYGVPGALPIYDVLVAVALSLIAKLVAKSLK